MSYYLAPALVKLRAEINAVYPKRDHASDGWIGDPSHAARKSDHNPDYSDGGIVRAIDVDKDGINPDKLVALLIKDPRVNYVIWSGHIYSRAYKFAKRVYTGTNGHYHHVHVSIMHNTSLEKDTRSWKVSSLTATVSAQTVAKPAVVTKKVHPNIIALQRALRTTPDNVWGGGTEKHGVTVREAAINNHFPYGVKFAQQVVGVKQDGDWGNKSKEALVETVKAVQSALVSEHQKVGAIDGDWGKNTDAAYKAVRTAARS